METDWVYSHIFKSLRIVLEKYYRIRLCRAAKCYARKHDITSSLRYLPGSRACLICEIFAMKRCLRGNNFNLILFVYRFQSLSKSVIWCVPERSLTQPPHNTCPKPSMMARARTGRAVAWAPSPNRTKTVSLLSRVVLIPLLLCAASVII